ncbi:FAST kinase-like protein, subdomain 1 [Popillia japonica]|uniref:FAST kinase-like protein, subdomain 1 n=1 Tax=Popillia japonica TaxID=7064 RepID=A0AAW1IU10_POPJA
MLKFTRIVQNTKGVVQNLSRIHYSTASSVELKNVNSEDVKVSNDPASKNKNPKSILQFRNSMVAAAFASLEKESRNEIQTPQTDSQIASAKSVDELLAISQGNGVSRNHALKVISILGDWSLEGKVKLPDFEGDPRFIKLCKMLMRTNVRANNRTMARSEDLSTILSITADDEAAKLVASITVPQMVKVMATLTQRKRRSMILLRALSFNITRSTTALDLKQCGDLLYGMAVLNFPDENLVQRVCIDACKGIGGDLQKSAVLGSILTSLGLLKYKDNAILEASCQWMETNTSLCRPQDLFALFMTMAVLNYKPLNEDNFFKKLLPQLSQTDAPKPIVWLDLVWSLVLLNRATPELINTIFSKEFISSLNIVDEQSIAHKLKLVNIDSAVRYLTPSYTGSTLDIVPEIRNVKLLRTKDKEEMSTSIIECLKNLISEKHFKTKVDSNMGFYFDAECYFDNKCNPLLPENYKSLPEQRKVAIFALDYHDMCKGSVEPTGINVLAMKLLAAQGYRVLPILYTEYRSRDKLVDRVRYLEAKLKQIVQL